MSRSQGFPAVARADARVLILGSMPGVASLRAGRYYAHPRNQFWPIMDRLFGAGPQLPYRRRLQRLRERRIALWDVLAECRRPGSLDSNIDLATARPNDFRGLLRRCPGMRAVFFNGQRAELLFRRLVLAGLPDEVCGDLILHRLPSTSPAHAGMDLETKLLQWRRVAQTLRRSLGSP